MATIKLPVPRSSEVSHYIVDVNHCTTDDMRWITAPVSAIHLCVSYEDDSEHIRYEDLEIYLGRDLEQYELSVLPEYYAYEPSKRMIYRQRHSERGSKWLPEGFLVWAPYLIILDEEEDPNVGITMERSHIYDHTLFNAKWFEWEAFLRLFKRADGAIREVYMDQLGTGFFRTQVGSLSGFEMPPMALSKWEFGKFDHPQTGTSFGLSNLRKTLHRNTSSGLSRALFPDSVMAVRETTSNERRLLLSDERVEKPVMDWRMFDNLRESPALYFGVRDDAKGYRLPKDPDWMQGELWDAYRVSDGSSWADRCKRLHSRVHIWRSPNAWHFLFGMLCYTAHGNGVSPIMYMTPVLLNADQFDKAPPTNLRGLPPKYLSELHKARGLTAAMAYALNAVQGRLFKLSQKGFDREDVTYGWASENKASWEVVASLSLNEHTLPLKGVRYLPTVQAVVEEVSRYATYRKQSADWHTTNLITPSVERIQPVDSAPSEELQPVAMRMLDL